MNSAAPQHQRPQVLYRTPDGRLVAANTTPATALTMMPSHQPPRMVAQMVQQQPRQQQQAPPAPVVITQHYVNAQQSPQVAAAPATSRPHRAAPLTAWRRDLATTGLATCIHPQVSEMLIFE